MTLDQDLPFGTSEEQTGPAARTMRLHGEFDLAARESFENELARIVRDGVRELEVDLSGLTFMDSSGIRALLAAKQLAARGGFELSFVLPSEGQVRKLLELTGVGATLSTGEEAA